MTETTSDDANWAGRAIVLIHGIGEHRRGDSLDALIRGLKRCGVEGGELIQDDRPFGEALPQDAIRLRRDGEEADIYEVYWASLAARKTTARSVLWWLLRTTFIPGTELRRPSTKTWWDIAAGLVAVTAIAVVVLYGLTSLGNLSAQVSCRADPTVTCEIPPEQRNVTGPEVTWGGPGQVTAIFGTLQRSLTLENRPLKEFSPSHAAEVLSLIPLRYWLWMIVIAFVSAQALYRFTQILGGLMEGRERFRENRIVAQFLMLLLFLSAFILSVQTIAPVMTAFVLVLVVVSGVGRVARGFLAESLGDVQVYSERDENSEHYEAREAILEEAERTFALLAVRDYRHIVVVGHSLGSVIAFTALDRLTRRIPRLLDRIEAFITVGSALEKVRYFFERRKPADPEASARLLYPAQKIAAERVWLNLWYANDVVANPITTFQPPGTEVTRYRLKEIPPFSELIEESKEQLVVNIDFGYPVLPLPIVWTHSRYWSDPSVMELIADVGMPRPRSQDVRIG